MTLSRRLILVVCAVLVSAAAAPAETPREMYAAARTRELAVRRTLAADDAPETALGELHAVVAAYQAVVRQYPTSGYCDNALWQAARLALDGFDRFGRPQDRATGVRLLRSLAKSYPTSKLAAQVPAEIAKAADDRPAEGAAQATIRDVRRTVLGDAVRITIQLDREVSFHDERMASPARIFLDLSSAHAVPALVDRTLRFDGDGDTVKQIRVGRPAKNATRIVIEAGRVSRYSIYPLYDPYRLVIDCVKGPEPIVPPQTLASRRLLPELSRALPAAAPRASAQIAAARSAAEPAPLIGRSLRPQWSPAVAAPSARPSGAIANALASTASPPAAGLPVPPADEPSSPDASADAPGPMTNRTGFSMARQLGLRVSRIVIDPGHGGHDPGAKGDSVDEAELVLDVALRLEKLLQRARGTEVILTRRTDEFIPLPERTAIANREGADLFLSIHANASERPSASGVETYFLNFASNMSAAAVATRENAASGQSMGALPDLVKAIALNNKLDESRDLATEVQLAMLQRLRLSNKTVKDLGVKQAPFAVLIGAAMPSVLAEISFVTNPREAKLLRSSAYRQRIAEALFNAVRRYQTSLQTVATVAHH